jgi:hypothetical protein
LKTEKFFEFSVYTRLRKKRRKWAGMYVCITKITPDKGTNIIAGAGVYQFI